MTESSTTTMNSTTDEPTDQASSLQLWSKMTVPHLLRHCVEEEEEKGNNKHQHTSYKLTDKVDHHGNYLEFPNVTVIHPLSCSAKVANLPLRLHQTVGVYISPLPSSSYHATLLCGPLHADLNGPSRPEDNLFAECLEEPCWQQIARYLSQQNYAPANLTMSQVVVSPRSGGVKIYLKPETDDNDIATARRIIRQELRAMGVCKGKLKESLERLGQQTDLGKKALRNVHRLLSCLMEVKEREWHITIAYPRKSGGPMPKEVQEQVKRMVRDAFQTETGTIPLEPAQLCLSSDMTSFVPWNGFTPSPQISPKILNERTTNSD